MERITLHSDQGHNSEGAILHIPCKFLVFKIQDHNMPPSRWWNGPFCSYSGYYPSVLQNFCSFFHWNLIISFHGRFPLSHIWYPIHLGEYWRNRGIIFHSSCWCSRILIWSRQFWKCSVKVALEWLVWSLYSGCMCGGQVSTTISEVSQVVQPVSRSPVHATHCIT